MSYHEYQVGREIDAQDFPFYALIQAAMRKADGANVVKLMNAFPETYEELQARYNAPGGYLDGERS